MAESSLISQDHRLAGRPVARRARHRRAFRGRVHTPACDRRPGQPRDADVVDAASAVPGGERRLATRTRRPSFASSGTRTSAPKQWQRSPMKHMLETNISVLRRRLTGPGALLDFEILKDLAKEGYTDYLVMATRALRPLDLFRDDCPPRHVRDLGVRSAGRLHRRRPRRAAADPAAARDRLQDGHPVAYLQQYRRGLSRPPDRASACSPARSGSATASRRARSSGIPISGTRRGSRRPCRARDFLDLLNVYFECSARPAIAAGGEVLAFVGDAVLAIFPIDDDAELPALTRKVTEALQQVAGADRRDQRRARRRTDASRSATASA